MLGNPYGLNLFGVLERILYALGAASARLYLILYGRAVLAARYGEPEIVSSFDSKIASAATLLKGELDDTAIASAIAKLSGEATGAVRIFPLATCVGGTRRLVGLAVLGDCQRAPEASDVDFAALAAQLDEDDATDAI